MLDAKQTYRYVIRSRTMNLPGDRTHSKIFSAEDGQAGDSDMREMLYLRTLGLVIVLLTVVGCATMQTGAGSENDQAVQRHVLERLQQDGVTASHGLGVRVRGGVAMLNGSVPDETVRVRAMSIVRATPGVTEVRENLYVW